MNTVRGSDERHSGGSKPKRKLPGVQRCCCPGLLVALREQTQALTLQAAAIDRLAASNEALVDALYQEDADGGPTSPHLGAAPTL